MLSKYLMGAATAVALAGPAMADNWTMTTTWPSSLELIEIDKKFVEIANALVDDADLTIEFFEGGSLVPAGEVFGAVESGTIQAGGDWPGYWAGRDAAFALGWLAFFVAARSTDLSAAFGRLLLGGMA